MAAYLGIYGGATRTVAVAADENGKILARVTGLPINISSIGMVTARKNLREIMQQVELISDVKYFESACIGLSSVTSRVSAAATLRFIDGIVNTEIAIMDSDAFLAMQCLFESGPCAVVMSGTGSMVVARDAHGRVTHKGGWGYLLGDEGSGYAIANDAIHYAVRAFDGSEPESLIQKEVFDFFNCVKPEELKDRFYNPIIDRSLLASFGTRVFACAAEGDRAALNIISHQAKLLAGTAHSLLKDFDKDITVGLWGGVFTHNMLFRNAFAASMFEKNEFYEIQLLKFPAECGALFAAFALKRVEITETLMRNIDIYRGVRV